MDKLSMRILKLLNKLDAGQKLTQEAQTELSTVTVMDLSKAEITTLPEAIGQLTNLQNLNLEFTPITALPETIGQLTNLQDLDLGFTPITALPETIGQLTNLQNLNLRYSQITDLPETIGQLTNLQNLDLGLSHITDLPETIGQLTNLQNLDLRCSHITDLPETIGQLTNLQNLDLGLSHITDLPETIGRLTNLRSLDLSGTPINALPETIGQLPNLQYLILENLTLNKIPRSLALCGLPFYFRGLTSDDWNKPGIWCNGLQLRNQNVSVFEAGPEAIRLYFTGRPNPRTRKRQLPVKENRATHPTKAPAETGKTLPEDLLDRDPFVDLAFQVAEKFSAQGKTACYAINGPWGAGKTYVLDKLEQKLREPSNEKEGNQFLVLRYNCWEYDYYDEPLISVVATMLDGLKQYQFSEKTRASLISAFRTVGKLLLDGMISYVDEKTDGAASELVDVIESYQSGKRELLTKSRAFNDKLPFQEALKTLQTAIQYLSKEQTVVFLVDELDRCLPEYAIRVLERLHHLFEGIDNVQVIFSVDRKQLEHVVRQLYGADADVRAYLKKFISFELKLELGSLRQDDEDLFYRRFASYVKQFTTAKEEKQQVAAFSAEILEGFDIRQRIALVEKAELVHSLTWGPGTPDSVYLCMELFLTVLDAVLTQLGRKPASISLIKTEPADGTGTNYSEVDLPDVPCFDGLREVYQTNRIAGRELHHADSGGVLHYSSEGVYGSVLLALLAVLDDADAAPRYSTMQQDSDAPDLKELENRKKDYATAFWEMLQHLA